MPNTLRIHFSKRIFDAQENRWHRQVLPHGTGFRFGRKPQFKIAELFCRVAVQQRMRRFTAQELSLPSLHVAVRI